MGARAPQPQSGQVMGIAEIRGEKIGGGVGVPDHLGQTNYAKNVFQLQNTFRN